MNSREIFELLLAGKKLKLSFPDAKSFNTLRSSLYVYKTRYSNNMSKLGYGCGDILEGKSIICEILYPSDIPETFGLIPTNVVVLISVGSKETEPVNFTILEISE